MEIKPAMVAIAAFVVITVIAAVLMPVLTDATAKTDTLKNEGYYNITYSETDSLSFSWDYTKPTVATIDNVEVTLPAATDIPGQVTILCGDDWFLRWSGNGMQFYSTSSGSVNASVADSTSMTFVATSGTGVVTNTAATPATQTVSYTFIYVIDPNGTYVMKESTEAAHLNGDSEIYAIGRTTGDGINAKIKITGNIDDGFTATVIGSSNYTTSNIVADYSEDSSHIDLYDLKNISLTITNTGTSQSITAVYSYFIVPAEVTAERSVHLSDNENAILLVIPALLIIAIIIGILAYAIRMRE